MDNANYDPQSLDDLSQDGKRQSSQKRKIAEGSPSQPLRAKRNRYISIACNECKRRKIKCNGESPCHRCGNLSLDCVYAPNCCSNGFKDSDEYRQMSQHLQSLQEQVDGLYADLSSFQHKTEAQRTTPAAPIDPQLAYQGHNFSDVPIKSRPTPQFSGPTSPAYDINVANNSLQSVGLNQTSYGTDERHSSQEGIMTDTESPHFNNIPQQNVNPVKDPLLSLTQDEVMRLCKVYDEEIASTAPLLDMGEVTNKARTLFTFMESMRKVGFLQKSIEQGESFSDEETLILKMILATALTIESGGQSDLGRALFENVRRLANLQDRLGSAASLKYLQLLTITGQYYLQSDEEIQAYRVIGIAARACFEMGLHRSDVVNKQFTSKEEFKWALRLFWVIYHLDRHWSFGTGLPFAIQDIDIDPQLPEPDSEVPFLKLCVTHGRVASKVWTSIAGFENVNNDSRRNDIGFLDYQIQQWQSSIPESLKYQPGDNFPEQSNLNKRQRRLRLRLYLQGNQTRIQLYRPVLFSITSILENRGYAQTAVDIAKETIRTLSQVHRTSDLYRSPQAFCNYYLMAALAVVFLAISHAPAEFSSQVREEFYMALDLIKEYRSRSYISRRLWKTIKGLKDIAPKLGLTPAQRDDPNNPATAALAMAGLAGHQVDETKLFSPGQAISSMASSPMSGQQMSHELTSFFEAAQGYTGAMVSGGMMGSHNGLSQMESFQMAGNEEELVKVMKECF